MNILVVGNGGREDCLCWKIKSGSNPKRLFCAPGNPGSERWAENVSISVDQTHELLEFAKVQNIDLCIVGPELPLSLGLVDLFRANGIPIFGPEKAAAELEASKAFAKEVMVAAGVPTARYELIPGTRLKEFLQDKKVPFVLKADGLAAGKGVVVCMEEADVAPAIHHLTENVHAEMIVYEEFLEGVEISCIYACHDEKGVALSTAHDYKRLFDRDAGPNTGGMGTVSPSARMTEEQHATVYSVVIEPTLREMKKRNKPFTGFLYAGLMLRPDGTYTVLEFNTRLGDPETQVLLPRLDGDLAQILMLLLKGETPQMVFNSAVRVCVVLASKDYPNSSATNEVIEGIEFAEQQGAMVFHAGTTRRNSTVVTSGGRVLNVVGSGASVALARTIAYRAADMIQFAGRQLRRDIGLLS